MALALGRIAAELDATLHGDAELQIHDIVDLSRAGPGEITLLTDAARLEEARGSSASAFVVRRYFAQLDAPQLVCPDAGRALASLLRIFRPGVADARRGVDARAAVEPGARIDETAWVGPFVFVGARAQIGAACLIEPFSYIGHDAVLDERCRVGPAAVVGEGCRLAAGAVVGPGAVIGHDGFGYYRDEQGWRRIASIGSVTLGQDVEVGANSCIDRGTLGATSIGPGTKIDNLVQVAHNVAVGARALLCAQVGLAGSARVGDDAVLAGQVGVADHRSIGRGAQIGAGSGVSRNVPDAERMSGYPAMRHSAWLRACAVFAQLGKLTQQVRVLRNQVDVLLSRRAAAGE